MDVIKGWVMDFWEELACMTSRVDDMWVASRAQYNICVYVFGE